MKSAYRRVRVLDVNGNVLADGDVPVSLVPVRLNYQCSFPVSAPDDPRFFVRVEIYPVGEAE